MEGPMLQFLNLGKLKAISIIYPFVIYMAI